MSKHLIAIAFIVVFFFVMTYGYEAIVLPSLSRVSPAAVIYFGVGAENVPLPVSFGTRN